MVSSFGEANTEHRREISSEGRSSVMTYCGLNEQRDENDVKTKVLVKPSSI